MRTQKSLHQKDYGFTLVELVTVMAITAVLVSLLYPVFVSSRERANNAMCLSNLKQIGIAMSLYTADYDTKYPYACSPEDITQPDTSILPPEMLSGMSPFNVVLEPYVRNKSCWKCPLDTQHYVDQYGTSYRYSEYLDEPDIIFNVNITKVPLAFDGSINWHTADPTSDDDMAYVNVIYEDLHAKRGTWFATTNVN